jgi:hypothetical protein
MRVSGDFQRYDRSNARTPRLLASILVSLDRCLDWGVVAELPTGHWDLGC